ncbi:MAG TPA: SusC/RagA family TonB-linked outer membrane protein [Mucilaginibacter sp.]|nr:SusC/RagA family TonB-linked outer membrane protein [Mucilaginibacter sp.]
MYKKFTQFLCTPPGYIHKFLLIMKLTTLIIIIAFVHVSAASFAQKVTYKSEGVTLAQMIKEIRLQTGYNVLVSANLIGNIKPKNVNFKDAPLEEVMDTFLADQPLTYVIEEKTILIQKKDPTSSSQVIPNYGTPVTVTGKVTDELGVPMSGVTIREKGTANGVVTDLKGSYVISVTDDKAIISFSYIGYETQELRAKDIANGSVIALKTSSTNLHEVIVNKGYYNTTQIENTGDVSQVSAKEIATQPVGNVMEAIEGRIPGLSITQTTGLPGAAFKIVVQGENSLINGNDPLYVIDGVPYNSELNSQIGYQLGANNNSGGPIQGYGSPLSYLNPYDIESVTILKDADATSIYGSRGANGVILITTKKGKAGKTTVNVGVNEGVGKVARFLNLLNTPQYIQLRREADANDGITPTVDNDPDLMLYDTTRYTNWQKQLIGGAAHYTDVQLGVSGGNTNTQFLLSGDFHRQTTVFPGDFADKKGSIHFNLNHTSDNQKFKVNFSAFYLYDNNLLPVIDPTSLIFLPPNAPAPVNPNGTINWDDTPDGVFTWYNGVNPQAALDQTYNTQAKNLIAHSDLSYLILPGLNVKASFGYTTTQMNEQALYPSYSWEPTFNAGASAQYTNDNTTTWVVEPQIDYKTTFGKGKFNVLIGAHEEGNSSNAQNFYGYGYPSDLLIQDMQAASSLTIFNNANADYKYTGVYARIGYNWDNKYVINLTERRDGSSRFGANKQFHNFGSVAAAYVFSNESFVKNNVGFLSTGKLRGSYGTTGNDQIGDYRFLDVYNPTSFLPYNGTIGLTPNNLANPNLAWEESRKWSGGLDLGFINDRIVLSADYFKTLTSNELVGYLLPSIAGFNSITKNLPATVQNTGFEFALNTSNIESKRFHWRSSFNITIPHNKLVDFPGLASSTYRDSYVIGQPIDIYKVYNYAGVNPTTGLYQFVNSQGQLTSTPNASTDRTIVENTDPKLYGGFQNTFTYGNFELNMFVTFIKRTGNNLLHTASGPGGTVPGFQGVNQPVEVLNHWKSAGDSAPFEMVSSSYGNAYTALSDANFSSAAYADASFIRLKNLQLAYNFGSTFIQRLHIQGCQIFVQGQNLFTIVPHNYYGLDPETQSVTSLPTLRTMTIGFHLSL